jgi:hypothetical protein
MSPHLRAATHAKHYATAPTAVSDDGSRHWITRAANFVVVVSHCPAGAALHRALHPDESLVLLPAGTEAIISAGTQKIEAEGNSLTILPPGDSAIEVIRPGIVVRVFSSRASDLAAAAQNASAYVDGAPEAAPLTPWPEPPGGFALRHYRLDEYPSCDPSPLKMRVFRSANLMINIFMPWVERRDETRLSPHSHDDFEQMSIALQGRFVHHIRYPWSPDKTTWREDEHEIFDSPSVIVIPAKVIHTTQDVGTGATWLIDVFGPPRVDFASKPGFVLNEADYPMPSNAPIEQQIG